MNVNHQYLKVTGIHEKIVRNGSRNGLRRKNGVNIIDEFLQKAIDARDIELLTASIVVAKDIITNDGPENDPNHASPSRISPRQRQLLSGDVEAMNLIVRAEGYLSLLTKQKLSHEAVAAVCRRETRGNEGVSRDENEDGNGGQQVDAFVESFYSTYQSSLMYPGGSSVNASQDSRDETFTDAAILHPGVTPAPSSSATMTPSSSTTPIPSAVPVPTPSTNASLEVCNPTHIQPFDYLDVISPIIHVILSLSYHYLTLTLTLPPQYPQVISDAGHFVAGAFTNMLYGMGSIIPYIGPDQDSTNTTDERVAANAHTDPVTVAVRASNNVKVSSSSSSSSSGNSLVSPMITAITTPSTSTTTTVDSLASRGSTAITPGLPPTAQAAPPTDSGLPSSAPSAQPSTHPSTGPPSRPLSLSYMVGASHMTHPNTSTNSNGSSGYNLSSDFDLSDVLTPPSCKQPPTKPLMPSSSSQFVANDFISNDNDSSNSGSGMVDAPPRLGLHPVKHRPLAYDPAQTHSRVRHAVT